MGLGPTPAIKNALKNAKLKFSDINLIELNEAFASQSVAVIRDLELDPAKVNPNGGAIALGHPVGATGCILAVKMMYDMKRTGAKTGLITMCIGGGQGISALFKNLE